MFTILTYYVNVKRVAKVMKICRKYLIHIQKSVFEGTISAAKLNKLKREVEQMIDKNVDAVCIYKIGSLKYASKEQFGYVTAHHNIID